MEPKTPEEFYSQLFMAAVSRIYGDVTAEARRRRITEHDIATIENRIIAMMGDAKKAAHEFQAFEVEPLVNKLVQELRALFGAIREARKREIGK